MFDLWSRVDLGLGIGNICTLCKAQRITKNPIQERLLKMSRDYRKAQKNYGGRKMIKNCKSCIRHLYDEPVCKLPDGIQGEATEFVKELDCEDYYSIVKYLKLLTEGCQTDRLLTIGSSQLNQIIRLLEER